MEGSIVVVDGERLRNYLSEGSTALVLLLFALKVEDLLPDHSSRCRPLEIGISEAHCTRRVDIIRAHRSTEVASPAPSGVLGENPDHFPAQRFMSVTERAFAGVLRCR